MNALSRRLAARPRLVLVPFILTAVALLVVPFPATAEATTHHLTVDATQFEFTPGRVTVNQGDRVIITVTASDVVHGFYLDGYGLAQRVEPGVAQQIEFVASKAGKFRYRCSVSCGPLHPFMIGELVVEGNTPFWRALGFTLVAAVGMLAYLWQTGSRQTFQEVISGTS